MQTEYAGYDEMVERGFDVHELDYISTKEEFLEIYILRDSKIHLLQTSIIFRKHGRHSIYRRDPGKREYHL